MLVWQPWEKRSSSDSDASAMSMAPAHEDVRPRDVELPTDAAAGTSIPISSAAPKAVPDRANEQVAVAAMVELSETTEAVEPVEAVEAAGTNHGEHLASAHYLPHLHELPPTLRQTLPDLVFSSHMYASMPRFRSVTVNGLRLREGDALQAGLRLLEVTETGVIMQVNESLFQVDILSQW
jgi:general secretion pathway protein B